MTALRRRFLLDMAWPVSSDLLCHMFGLVNTSADVAAAEREDSEARMQRLATDMDLMSEVVTAAQDAAQVLALVEDDDERTAWLSTYAMALLNLLEQTGKIRLEVAA